MGNKRRPRRSAKPSMNCVKVLEIPSVGTEDQLQRADNTMCDLLPLQVSAAASAQHGLGDINDAEIDKLQDISLQDGCRFFFANAYLNDTETGELHDDISLQGDEEKTALCVLMSDRNADSDKTAKRTVLFENAYVNDARKTAQCGLVSRYVCDSNCSAVTSLAPRHRKVMGRMARASKVNPLGTDTSVQLQDGVNEINPLGAVTSVQLQEKEKLLSAARNEIAFLKGQCSQLRQELLEEEERSNMLEVKAKDVLILWEKETNAMFQKSMEIARESSALEKKWENERAMLQSAHDQEVQKLCSSLNTEREKLQDKLDRKSEDIAQLRLQLSQLQAEMEKVQTGAAESENARQALWLEKVAVELELTALDKEASKRLAELKHEHEVMVSGLEERLCNEQKQRQELEKTCCELKGDSINLRNQVAELQAQIVVEKMCLSKQQEELRSVCTTVEEEVLQKNMALDRIKVLEQENEALGRSGVNMRRLITDKDQEMKVLQGNLDQNVVRLAASAGIVCYLQNERDRLLEESKIQRETFKNVMQEKDTEINDRERECVSLQELLLQKTSHLEEVEMEVTRLQTAIKELTGCQQKTFSSCQLCDQVPSAPEPKGVVPREDVVQEKEGVSGWESSQSESAATKGQTEPITLATVEQMKKVQSEVSDVESEEVPVEMQDDGEASAAESGEQPKEVASVSSDDQPEKVAMVTNDMNPEDEITGRVLAVLTVSNRETIPSGTVLCVEKTEAVPDALSRYECEQNPVQKPTAEGAMAGAKIADCEAMVLQSENVCTVSKGADEVEDSGLYRDGLDEVIPEDPVTNRALKDAGAIAVRRVLKKELKRIAKANGAVVCLTLTNLEGEASFEVSMLGQAEEVEVCSVSTGVKREEVPLVEEQKTEVVHVNSDTGDDPNISSAFNLDGKGEGLKEQVCDAMSKGKNPDQKDPKEGDGDFKESVTEKSKDSEMESEQSSEVPKTKGKAVGETAEEISEAAVEEKEERTDQRAEKVVGEVAEGQLRPLGEVWQVFDPGGVKLVKRLGVFIIGGGYVTMQFQEWPVEGLMVLDLHWCWICTW